MPLLGLENHEAADFGPLFRSDACNNIIENLALELRAASKVVPGECAAAT